MKKTACDYLYSFTRKTQFCTRHSSISSGGRSEEIALEIKEDFEVMEICELDLNNAVKIRGIQ